MFYWSIISAPAGFLFGFDTVVISGAEKTIQSVWNLTPGMHRFALGSALYNTVIGSMVGGWPIDKSGIKQTQISIGILYVIAALGCALAQGVGLFIAARCFCCSRCKPRNEITTENMPDEDACH